jgi:hypothetical protein
MVSQTIPFFSLSGSLPPSCNDLDLAELTLDGAFRGLARVGG